nr:hypothetical protein [Tanacetum cinerariifolium]
SSSASTTTQNIAFVSSSNTDSTNEPVSVAASVSAVSAKILVYSLINVDSLSNVVIYSFFPSQSSSPQLDNDDLKQIDADDLEEILPPQGWLIVHSRLEDPWFWKAHESERYVECATDFFRGQEGILEQMDLLPWDLICPKWSVTTATEKDTLQRSVGSYDWSFQAEKDPTNYALMAFSSLSSSSDNELRDNVLVSLRQNLEKSEQERDDLKLKLEKFKTSSNNLSELLASQTNDKTGLGYNSQVFTHAMFDCDDYLSSMSDDSLPHIPIYDRYQSGNGYHAVSPPYTGIFMLPKPDLVFNNEPNVVETNHPAFNVKLSPTKPDQDLSRTHRPSAPIIEDWVSDSEDEFETKTPQNLLLLSQQVQSLQALANAGIERHALPVSTAVPKISVTRPRQAKTIVTKTNPPPRRYINGSPSPKASTFPPKVTVVKAPRVNATQVVQGKWEWKQKCLILDRVSRNRSASMTLKRFDYNDALGRSKSVMAWVPKRI